MPMPEKLDRASEKLDKMIGSPVSNVIAQHDKNVVGSFRAKASPGIDYAQRIAAKHEDAPTLASTVGIKGSTMKEMPSYKEGTASVPKTGPAMLHKGEAVIPKEKNPYSAITEGDKKPAKKLKSIHTRRAKSGGYIHEHHYTEPAHHPMEEHTTADAKAMLSHMADHMGEESPAGEAAEEQGPQGAAAAQEHALGME